MKAFWRRIMDYSSYAINDGSRHQKALKIISCVEYILNQKLHNKKILEIGAGSGIISYNLIQGGNDVISIDISDNLFRNTILPDKKVQFLLANGILMPFKDEMFDIVICNQVIEHIPRNNQLNLVKEIFRVLCKDGLVYMATPNKFWPIEPHTKLPLISYFPQKISDIYLNYAKGTKFFNVYLLDYYHFRKILSAEFNQILDLTPIVIKNPDAFFISDEIPKKIQKILMKLPLSQLRIFSPCYPSWIMIGIK
jgi:ubiquinone/menaquinone biosynthesis C-methylase UbiE